MKPRKSAPGGSKIEARGGRNGLLEGFRGWKDRALKPRPFLKRFWNFDAPPPPPGASQIDKKSFTMRSKIEAFFGTRFEPGPAWACARLAPPGPGPSHLEASREAFGFDFGEPRARSAILAKIEPTL